jgi:glycosyltransferase involved in cell wall biosynthesis
MLIEQISMPANELPAVSVGIPFYNAEKYLLDAVKSVFAQTHQNWELILIDDGSTDRSLEIARAINDPRVRVYSDGKNKRLAARLNELTHLAKHEFLARMDADDLMSRRRLERQLRVLISDQRVDLVTTGVCSLGGDCEPMGLRSVAEGHVISPYMLLRGNSGIVHASVLGRREWFLRNPYKEDLPLAEDANLWVRAYARKDLRVRFIPDPLYYYREDGNVVVEKLLLSYAIGTSTIWHGAGREFRLRDKIRALVATYSRRMAVRALSASGRMDIVRARRNSVPLTSTDRARILKEIADIRALYLPGNRRLNGSGIARGSNS